MGDSYLSSGGSAEAEQNVVLGKQSSLGEWSSLTPKQTGGCELSLTPWDCVMSESAVRWGESGRQGNLVRNTAGAIAVHTCKSRHRRHGVRPWR